MRVLHVLTVPMTLRFLRGQVGFMQKHGVDIHVACAPGPELDRFAEEERVAMHPISITRRVDPVADLSSVGQAVALMRRLRPDVVHAHTPKGGLVGMLGSSAARVRKRIYHLRGLPLLTAEGVTRPMLWSTESTSFSLSTDVLAVSQSLVEAVHDYRILGAHKARVIGGGSSNGVDALGRFDPEKVVSKSEARRILSLPQDAVVVACVGRLARDKGIAELLDAWSSVSASDRVLLLVGSSDERDGLDMDTMRRLRTTPGVIHREFDEDIARVFAAADLLVHPSHREGFPNVPLEAAAMGLPIVTTTAVGCRDAVLDQTTGTLVPVKDAAALARQLERYIADPELRRVQGEAARARVLREFLPERIWQGTLDAYLR